LPAAAVQAGLAAALTVGSCNPDVVAVEARKASGEVAAAAPETDLLAEDHPVISLTERRLTTHRELPADTRSLPSVVAYDDLLSSSRRSS
jgi:hypothetical protein